MRAETYDPTDKRVDVAGQIQDNRTIVRSVATSPARAPLELPTEIDHVVGLTQKQNCSTYGETNYLPLEDPIPLYSL